MGVHRSTVYKSASTGKRKVAFSAPNWNAKQTTEHRECLGVLVMSFDVSSLCRSADAIGSRDAILSRYGQSSRRSGGRHADTL